METQMPLGDRPRAKYSFVLWAALIAICSTSPSIAISGVAAAGLDNASQTRIISESLSALGSPIAKVLHAELTNSNTVTLDRITIKTDPYKDVYAAMEYQPLWVDDNGLTERAKSALATLNRATEHGLNASQYGVDVIRTRATNLSLSQETSAQQLAELDLLMSNAVTRYMQDVRYGATPSQRKILADFRVGNRDTMKLLSQAAVTRNFDDLMRSDAPHTNEYAALKEALVTYRKIAEAGGWEAFPVGKAIKLGVSDKRIPALRRILSVMGDYSGDTSSESLVYDEALKDAVIAFQLRHGLNGEGVIGTNTQKFLAVPVEKRIAQIMVNLERMRWMPSDLGSKYAIVNVPAFTLTGYENGQKALNMRVIVGKPNTRTPIFSNVITDVVFNPSWGAPQSIVRKELLPKLRNNPSYFVNAGFTVYHNGVPVDPHSIDPDAGGSFNFRQRPGSHNALGKIKFNLPDNDDIYLHSTAKPELFKGEMRALSHGCIRLEDPRAMAQFVLGGEEGWDGEKIDKTYDSSTSRSVEVSPVAVHLVYWTAWVGDDGKVHFFDDVYKRDNEVSTALAPQNDEGVKLVANSN